MFLHSPKLCALAVPPLVWSALAGCSSGGASEAAQAESDAGDSQGQPVADGGVRIDAPGADSGRTSPYDAGVASADSGIVPDDAPAGCAPVTEPDAASAGTPVGTLLAPGNALSARGVTSDSYEIFSDDAALQLYAVPIAGGPPQPIVALGSKFWVTVVGQVVFAWSNVTSANVGALTVWSSSKGPHAIAPASFGILGASSSDGSQILYVANVDAGGDTGDVYVSGTDGSSATKLLGGQQLGGCYPQLGFVGSYAVASHCDVARGAGPSTTMSSFKSPGWARIDLVTDAENQWSADTAGTMILVSTGGGILTVPVGGGAPKTIDSTGFLGQLIAGGKTAIYSTTSGVLRSSPTATPSPMTLASSVGGFYDVSPDQSKVLYYANSSSAGTDAYLAAATTPGSGHALTTATDVVVNGDAFTADSTYALYSTSMDMCTGASAFSAFSVSGSAAVVLGHSVWGDWAATGAKVIFNDNYTATGGPRFGRADLESVNLATGSTPSRIVAGADAVVDLTPARDQIIYSWSLVPGALAGLYVTPVP